MTYKGDWCKRWLLMENFTKLMREGYLLMFHKIKKHKLNRTQASNHTVLFYTLDNGLAIRNI